MKKNEGIIMAKTPSKGTRENPYSMSECDSMPVLTQGDFDKQEKVCSITPAISTMLRKLYDAKRIVTYPTEEKRVSGRYNSITSKLELSESSVNEANRDTIFHVRCFWVVV